MALLGNLIAEASSAPGTGPFVLAGALKGRLAWSSSFANADECFYFATDGDQTEWGIGTFTAGTPDTISRTTIRGTSAGGTSPLNFTSTITVYNEVPASAVLLKDQTGNFIAGDGTRVLPAGLIMMWNGSAASIPAGWVLCNGANGTPNLEDKFIIGAGGAQAPGATGGASSVTPTTSAAGTHSHGGVDNVAGPFAMSGAADTQGAHSHGGATGTHVITAAEMPSHNHPILIGTAVLGTAGGGATIIIPDAAGVSNSAYISDTGSDNGHNHSISSDGAHSHNISVSNAPAHQHGINADGNHSHTVTVATVPPFFALCYIMKT